MEEEAAAVECQVVVCQAAEVAEVFPVEVAVELRFASACLGRAAADFVRAN